MKYIYIFEHEWMSVTIRIIKMKKGKLFKIYKKAQVLKTDFAFHNTEIYAGSYVYQDFLVHNKSIKIAAGMAFQAIKP